MRDGVLGAPVGALLPIYLVSCIQTVDLRTGRLVEKTDDDCPPGRRIDPSSGVCEPCRTDADRPCPCASLRTSAEFPYCEGDAAFYCLPCRGDVGACAARAADGSVRDCALLRECCSELALDPGSTPCCPRGASILCEAASDLTYELSYRCIDNSCCETDCQGSGQCDATFQECVGGTCTPGCDPHESYCSAEPACECRLLDAT